MTGPTSPPRMPGRILLKLAERLFDEPARSTIVLPAIADFQQEVREAGTSRTRQLAAHVRGYVAFSRLVLSAPFITSSSALDSPLTSLLLGKFGGNLLLVLAVSLLAAIAPVFGWFALAVALFGVALAIGLHVWNRRHPGARSAFDPLISLSAATLLAALWSMFGWFVVASITAAIVMAIALRGWNTRHPSVLAPRDSRPGAEINLSSIPVAGDVGGLLFVVAAIITVLLGLPDIRWFVLASVVAAIMLAGALFAWRSSHPAAGSPTISILQR